MNHFPRMAKCGSPEVTPPGSAALWAYLTLVYKGILGESCSNFFSVLWEGKSCISWYQHSVLHLHKPSRVYLTLHALWNGLISGQSALGPGSHRSPKYTLSLLGLQSPLHALDAFQTCSMCQCRGKVHSRFVAFMFKWAPDSFSALFCFTLFNGRHQLWWLQYTLLSWLFHVSLLSQLPTFPTSVLASTGKCQSHVSTFMPQLYQCHQNIISTVLRTL